MKTLMQTAFLFFAFLFLSGTLSAYDEERQKTSGCEIIQYDPQLKILIGGGGNSIILTSRDKSSAIVMDTKKGDTSKEVKDNVDAENVTIINTHFHSDHTGGNDLFPGAKIISGDYTKEQWAEGAKNSRYPDETIKPGGEKLIRLDDETVHIRNMGRAHTFNDMVAYFEKRKLLATGDLIFLHIHPVLYPQSGAQVSSWIKVLDDLDKRYDVKTLVPGHGPVSDKTALLEMKDYFTSLSGAVGNPDKQAELKEKYKDYYSLPGMTNFDNTLAYIENEKKQ
ncbi:MAG: MBL fold metallo-hydrolase [Candidatus Aureabacteria bacterium]|nr:MBL fold metallo-hydrolase [Candidatus Auribacterota bacterium]